MQACFVRCLRFKLPLYYLVAPEKPHILPYSYALGYSSSTTYAVKMN